MTATIATPVHYEVLWGVEDGQRQAWVDQGDGAALVSASRLLLQCAANGVRAGLFVDGAHTAGHDVSEEDVNV